MNTELLKIIFFVWLKRIPYFKKKKEQCIRRIELKHRYLINLEAVAFKGGKTLFLQDFKLSHLEKDLHLSLSTISLTINWKSFFKGKIHLSQLHIGDFKASFQRKNKKQEEKPPDENVVNPQYFIRGFYNNISGKIKKLIRHLPGNTALNNFNLVFGENSYHHSNCTIVNKKYNKPGLSSRESCLEFSADNVSMLKKGGELAFQSSLNAERISLNIKTVFGQNPSEINYVLESSFENAEIYSINLCDEKLVRQNFGSTLYITENEAGLLIGEPSSAFYNEIIFNIAYEHHYKDPDSVILKIGLAKTTMQKILANFSMFENKALYDAKFSGAVGFDTTLKVLFTKPTENDFTIESNSDLSLNDFENIDLMYLKLPFTYSVDTFNGVKRELILDTSAENFVPISDISPNLTKAILCTEDPNYFEHNGLDVNGIYLALFANLSTGTLAKGASTITMQLVKNLFLNKRKNFYRKIEELIFTWLIENVFRIEKERLFEIYLNIIEFGNNIYGVKEAATYYFDKSISNISITESLVLSYIIPRPKFFEEALLMNSDQLRKNLKKHIDFFSQLMLEKNLISQEVFDEVKLEVVFSPRLGSLNLNAV